MVKRAPCRNWSQFFVLFNLVIYLSAVVPCLLAGGMPYPHAPFSLHILREHALFFIDCLPMVGAQYLISPRLRNFLFPVGVGFMVWLGAPGKAIIILVNVPLRAIGCYNTRLEAGEVGRAVSYRVQRARRTQIASFGRGSWQRKRVPPAFRVLILSCAPMTPAR